MSKYYWHNIGSKIGGIEVKQRWWSFLVNNSQISAGFEDDPAKGQRVLQKYRVKDVVIAYASGSGAIGYGIIGDPSSYIHLVKGHADDRLNGVHLHRLSIQWKAVIPNLANAVKPARFELTHPIRTSCRIMDEQNAEKLTDYLLLACPWK